MVKKAWKPIECPSCKNKFYVHISWSSPPGKCEICRAWHIEDKCGMLKAYLHRRRRFSAEKAYGKDQEILQEEEKLRDVVRMIVDLVVQGGFFPEEAIQNKEFRRFLLKLDKERRINQDANSKKSKGRYGGIFPVRRVFQGGSPGLGKRK